jgi:hypothetical protein
VEANPKQPLRKQRIINPGVNLLNRMERYHPRTLVRDGFFPIYKCCPTIAVGNPFIAVGNSFTAVGNSFHGPDLKHEKK